MAGNGKPNVIFDFLQTCSERHVPHEVETDICLRLVDIPAGAERDAFLLQQISYIQEKWPFISMEEYLASIEESGDWKDLADHMRVYWKDGSSLLADAVRLRAVRTIRQIALHCLMNEPKLKEDMLALAPDQRTRKALMYPPRVKPEEAYKAYPFCIAESMYIYRWRMLRPSYAKIISLPPDMQEVMLHALMKQKQFETLDQLHAAAIAEDGPIYPHLSDHLYKIGYHVDDHGIIRRRIPEDWITEYLPADGAETWEEMLYVNIRGLSHEAFDLGWPVMFDGINNVFGYTGYTYLKEWP